MFAKGLDCPLDTMEKFRVEASFSTANTLLSYKHHWHQMDCARLFYCDGIPKTIAACNKDWSVGSKLSRPWQVGRPLPNTREFTGCTEPWVQKCTQTPNSQFTEINYWSWLVSHFNVMMSGSATFPQSALVSTGYNNKCSRVTTTGLSKKATSNQPFKECQFFFGSFDDNYVPGAPT